MRNAFAAAVTALAAVDRRVVLLSGDIGNRLFDEFKQRSPQRFYNCGVAEANMITMAAGMAQCGLRPFVYTITTFATSRVFEQIRIDVAYQGAPVVIVGTGSGLSYASLGPTHHSCEDVALLRLLPGMTVLCPADATEVRQAVNAVMSLDGPVYIRLGKKGEPAVHKKPAPFVIGKGIILRDGRDVCLLGMGNMVATALDAADVLHAQGLTARVVSMHTIKPLDEMLLAETFERFAIVAVVEEHNLMGGLGSAVGQWFSLRHPRPATRLLTFGTPDAFLCESGSQKYARQCFGLTAGAIARQIVQANAEGKTAVLIGVDFDNTIVRYDNLFRRLAVERGLFPAAVPASKGAVRDHLRAVGREDVWTALQGEVYGPRMPEAEPFPGVLGFFTRCKRAGVRVLIISHRTRFPYLGDKHDLHQAARDWLALRGFHNTGDIDMAPGDVHLELTLEDKLARIAAVGCSHFIDDLPEVLHEASFPAGVAKILFDPNEIHGDRAGTRRLSSWSAIEQHLFAQEA